MRALALLALLGASQAAAGEHALSPGFVVGAAVSDAPRRLPGVHLNTGAELLWLSSGGAAARARVELDETLASRFSVLGGWLGPGLLDNHGLPLGLVAGATLGWRDDVLRVGPRGGLVLGLYYARVTLELDLGVGLPLDGRSGTEWLAGVNLHLAPWRAWSLR